MKNKTKFLLTTLFILVAFLLLGTTNVNAATLVGNEEELRAAVSGSDSSITEVKLGANIELTGNLGIFPVNDLILDLNGNTIDGHTNEKYIYINYGENGLTSGSLTIKDSGESAGSIKSYRTIVVGNDNNDTSTEKTYGLTIENGQFYIRGSMWTDHVFSLTYSLANKNVTFDFQVKDGYFEKSYNAGGVLSLAEEFTNDNINLNIKLDKLTLYSTSQLNNKLIYSYSENVTLKLSDVLSAGSKVVLKKTGSETTGTVTDLDVSAISAEPLHSVLSNYNTIEVIKTEGFDVSNVTLNETYGYTTATSVAIPIKNRGTNPLKIKNVSVDSANFIVDGNSALIEPPTVAAGATDNTTATIKAKPGLNAGTYTATITVTDENDKTYTSTVTLTVAKKQILTLGVGYGGNWKYGESPATLNKYGVEDLTADQYVIDYSVHNSYDWSTTVPTLVGNYDVRIRVTDSNYDNTCTAISNFSIEQNDAEIRIIAATNEWTYDGNIHRDTSYIVKYNGEVKVGGVLPTGDTISDVSISATVKDVKDNRENNNEIDSFELPNYNCYSDVKTVAGTIKIKTITTPIVVTADSDTKAYDGSALTKDSKDSYTFTNGIVKTGDTLTATITGSQTYVGTSSNTVSNVKVMRGDIDITSNYTFGTHVNGALTVTAIDQPLSIADQYVTVGGTLLTSELEAALTGAEGNVSFEKKSGTAGEYNNETIGGFLAGSSEGTVVMTVKATSFDVNNDGTAEYNATEKDFNIHVVTKETVTISGITDNQEFTYDGHSKTPTGTITVTDNKVAVSDLEVSYAGTGSTTYSSTTAPKNAGTYTVTYKVPNSNANYVGEKVFNFTIKKAQLPKVTLKRTSYEYTGADISVPEPNNWISSLMDSTGDFEKTNVGSYTITVSLKDTTNYEWTDGTISNLILNWSITKANPSYEDLVPTNLTGLKGQTLNDITLPSGFTWNNASTPLVVGTKTYKATYTPSNTDNYNIMNNIDITIVTKDIFNVTTAVVGGNGTINGPFANVVEGTKKEIIFTPETGFMIDKVLVNDVETSVTGNKLTLTVDGDKDVKVSYKKIPFTITVEDTEGATITPNGVVTVNYGDNKEFTITPNNGYILVKVLVNDVDKTDEMVYDKLTLNNITANMEIKVVVERIVYEVIEGANQKYTITKDNEAKFRIDAEYGMFEDGGKVYVDDELVDEENYTSEEGSTIINLKQAYVDTLTVGQHTLKVVFADDGVATTNFTVAKVAEQPTQDVDNNNTNTENKEEDKCSNPKTFDNIMVYVAIAIMSVVGLGATVVIKKKKVN